MAMVTSRNDWDFEYQIFLFVFQVETKQTTSKTEEVFGTAENGKYDQGRYQRTVG